MWDLGPVPLVELTATQKYADHSSAAMKLFLDAKASADTLLDLCVLHIKVNSKQQLYICYWSWNTNGVNWFQLCNRCNRERNLGRNLPTEFAFTECVSQQNGPSFRSQIFF